MMEPIISPWIIYAVSLAGKINTIAFVGAFILGVVIFIAGAMYLMEDAKEAKGFIKKAWIPFAICMAMAILVPEKSVLLAMVAVQYITPDNVQAVQGNIVDFVGQIAQAAKDVK